jgi:hypothetical protein
MSQRGPDLTRSPDGRWEWDGQAWRPVSGVPPAGQPAPPQWGAQPIPTPAAGRRGSGQATASLVLGIVSLIAWLLPIVGLPVAITGLVLGILSASGVKRGMAITGIVLSSIGLVLGVINFAVGAYLGATGQLHLFQ